MAVTALDPPLTVREYLASSFEVDCDYVDGHIEERNVGEYDHSKLQFFFVRWFDDHSEEWGVGVVIETRVQVSPTRFRVPDISVL